MQEPILSGLDFHLSCLQSRVAYRDIMVSAPEDEFPPGYFEILSDTFPEFAIKDVLSAYQFRRVQSADRSILCVYEHGLPAAFFESADLQKLLSKVVWHLLSVCCAGVVAEFSDLIQKGPPQGLPHVYLRCVLPTPLKGSFPYASGPESGRYVCGMIVEPLRYVPPKDDKWWNANLSHPPASRPPPSAKSFWPKESYVDMFKRKVLGQKVYHKTE